MPCCRTQPDFGFSDVLHLPFSVGNFCRATIVRRPGIAMLDDLCRRAAHTQWHLCSNAISDGTEWWLLVCITYAFSDTVVANIRFIRYRDVICIFFHHIQFVGM